jgi:hypothetical protein
MHEVKKMFKLNPDGVSEWIIAENKNQAIAYAGLQWGIDVVLEHYQEFKENTPEATISDFIDYFAKEEPMNKKFTHCEYGPNYDQVVTKTIKEFLEDHDQVPCYFACSE